MRKSKYSENKQEICAKVLESMRGGKSTFKACEATGVSHSTFIGWVGEDDELSDSYARAREDLLERMAQEVLDLSDEEVPETGDGRKDWQAIQKHKLQVDTRKWLLSKLSPRKYGEKLEVSGDPANPLVTRIERVIVKNG
jgi:hypothetical protein